MFACISEVWLVLERARGHVLLYSARMCTIFTSLYFQVDSENERCLVQFEDSTAHWSLYKDLTKLKLPESDDLCVVCKSSKSWETNEIVLCHICEQGYHQDCLQVSSPSGVSPTGVRTKVNTGDSGQEGGGRLFN